MSENKRTRNIKLTLEFDGTPFCGFQIQKSDRTVQGELLEAIERITNEPAHLASAARTDSGVHAAGQVVNFHTSSKIPIDRLIKGLNALLPGEIAILDAEEMPESFHARFSAVSRTYVFSILNSPIKSAFKHKRFLHFPDRLDHEAMISAAKFLIGEQDFSAFRAASDQTEHSIRRMIDAGGWKDAEDLHFYFEANAFLQHMIRNIMGTLLWVGTGKIEIERFKQIIASKNRAMAGPTAPPHGLCLIKIKY
jgi:tRNA pseudouridine38-40 synthase